MIRETRLALSTLVAIAIGTACGEEPNQYSPDPQSLAIVLDGSQPIRQPFAETCQFPISQLYFGSTDGYVIDQKIHQVQNKGMALTQGRLLVSLVVDGNPVGHRHDNLVDGGNLMLMEKEIVHAERAFIAFFKGKVDPLKPPEKWWAMYCIGFDTPRYTKTP